MIPQSSLFLLSFFSYRILLVSSGNARVDQTEFKLRHCHLIKLFSNLLRTNVTGRKKSTSFLTTFPYVALSLIETESGRFVEIEFQRKDQIDFRALERNCTKHSVKTGKFGKCMCAFSPTFL